jgi:hypothetical protein
MPAECTKDKRITVAVDAQTYKALRHQSVERECSLAAVAAIHLKAAAAQEEARKPAREETERFDAAVLAMQNQANQENGKRYSSPEATSLRTLVKDADAVDLDELLGEEGGAE